MTNEDVNGEQGGFVYVVSNPTMPGIVKIGCTRRHPEVRVRELSSSTSVAKPFKVEAFRAFDSEKTAERILHERFGKQRLDPRREFFEIPVELATEALETIAADVSTVLPVTSYTGQVEGSMSAPTKGSKTREMRGPITSASILGHPYWSSFKRLWNAQSRPFDFQNPGRRFFLRKFLISPKPSNDRMNIHYEGRIRVREPQVSMRLILKTAPCIKELYDLISNDRSEIENEFGEPLIWNRDAGAYECHISSVRDDMDPRDIGDWSRQHSWLADTAEKYHLVFQCRVDAVV